MAKSIKVNFLYNILLNVSKVIFPLITAPYVSRVLEPDGVGLFNFAFNIANYFAFFAALGIPYYGIREIAKIKDDKCKQEKFVSEIISISIVSTILCIGVLLVSIWFIPQLSQNYLIFLVSAIVLYITPFRIDWFYSGKEEFSYITIRSLLIKILGVILLFVFVREKSDLLLYVALNAGCNVLNELWNFVKLYQSGIHPYFTLSGSKHIKPLFILFSSNIALSVYVVLDTIMLGFLSDYSEVGYYNSATHISKAFVPIVTSLAAVVLPRISFLREEGKWQEINLLMNKSFSIVAFLSFPITFGIVTIAPLFVPLFFGQQFHGAIIPLMIVSFVIIIIGFNNLTGIQVLLGFGLDKYFLYSVCAGAFSNMLFNFLLIPYYGASGAALSSVIAEIVVLSVMLYYVYKYTPVRFIEYNEVIRAFVLSASFLLIGFYLMKLCKGWLGVCVVGSSCFLIYVIFQFIFKSNTERELINLLIRRIRH